MGQGCLASGRRPELSLRLQERVNPFPQEAVSAGNSPVYRRNDTSRNLLVALLGAGVLFSLLIAFTSPSRASVIVNNLGAATTVSGVKNANPGTVSQGFTMGSSNGILNSLTLELGIIHTTAAENSSETMSVYLYAANSLGVPTGGPLATLATGITVGNIEAGASEGYTANNTSDIYEFAVTLSSNPTLTAGGNYAIEISLSSGTQSIGWAHSATAGSGELGVIDVNGASPPVGPGYGEMQITTVTNLTIPVGAVGPVNQTVCPGDNVTFSTVASGTGPYSYAWLENNVAISGQTNSSLTLNNVSAGDAATYSVIVNGLTGSVTNSATLTVNTPVTATPLSNVTDCPGDSATFSTVASGTSPFSYAWLKNGTLISGQSGSSLTLTNVSASDMATYSVIVSGACGSEVTNSATLTVNVPVTVTVAPVSQTTVVGSNVNFSVTAAGTGLSYQWLFNGSVIGISSSLTLNNVTASQAGIYTVIVNGACGSVTNSASLTVNVPVAVTVPPVSQTTVVGSNVTFSVTATGTGLSYQWLFGGTAIGTSSSLTLNNVTTSQAGVYTVIVSGAGSPVTNSATLTVNVPVTVTVPPVSQMTVVGSNVTFSVTATGTGLSYQWLFGGSVIGTSSSLTLNNVTPSQAGVYTVIVSGAGSPVTNSATLTVNVPVTATPLSNLVLWPGDNASFSTVASGTGPFNYVWLKNGGVISGQAGNSLTLDNVNTNDAATYDVIVSGASGIVTNSATLTVNLPVAPTLSIASQGDGSVKVSASGGVSGQQYVLQFTTDLVNWTVISTNTADSTGASTFINLDATNYPHCFYRTVTP